MQMKFKLNNMKEFDYETFFEWLRSIGKLDFYEAALDISMEYAGDQNYRLQACDSIDKLKKEYNETT